MKSRLKKTVVLCLLVIIASTGMGMCAGKDKDRTGETGAAGEIANFFSIYEFLMLPFFAITVFDYAPTRTYFASWYSLQKIITLQSNIDTDNLIP